MVFKPSQYTPRNSKASLLSLVATKSPYCSKFSLVKRRLCIQTPHYLCATVVGFCNSLQNPFFPHISPFLQSSRESKHTFPFSSPIQHSHFWKVYKLHKGVYLPTVILSAFIFLRLDRSSLSLVPLVLHWSGSIAFLFA